MLAGPSPRSVANLLAGTCRQGKPFARLRPVADEEWKAWLGKLDSAAIADAARRQGCPPRYMDAGIKPVWDGARILASAYTVRLIPGQGVWSASWDAMPHGSVLVVDARGRTDAIVWGELLSAEAARRGLVGAVVDGAVRDMAGVQEIGFPLFARAVVPGVAPWHGTGATQIPVTVGRVRVRPGDIVFGDELGVVVVAPEVWETVADAAQEIQRSEGERLRTHLASLRNR